MIGGIAIAASAHGDLQYLLPTRGLKASYIKDVKPGRLVVEWQVCQAQEYSFYRKPPSSVRPPLATVVPAGR